MDIHSSSGDEKKRESKGGLGYDLILEKPSCDAPAKTTVQTPTRQVSVEEINRKLLAAEERRLSYEAQKVNHIKEKESHIEELNKKRNELEEQYKESVRLALDKKMEVFRENRENYIKSIETKARDHVEAVEAKLKQSKDCSDRERSIELITKKLDSAAEAREQQLAALRNRLKEHEKHVLEVRLQQADTTNNELKVQLNEKLAKATENRDTLLKEIQEKQQEHERHVEDVRANRVNGQ